jgi:hypothetical protein
MAMRPAEWPTCTDARRMLEHLTGRGRGRLLQTEPGRRKLRLFGVACCRRVWHLLDTDCRGAVEVAERFADGAAGEDERAEAHGSAQLRWLRYGRLSRVGVEDSGEPIDRRLNTARSEAAIAASNSSCRAGSTEDEGAWGAAFHARLVHIADVAWEADAYERLHRNESPLPGEDDACRAAWAAEESAQCDLIRDIFGDPFGPRPVISPSWLTPAVLRLAEALYEGRDFEAMPMLGDALEEAGCDDPGLLGHCRGGFHARGCWMTDSILGKG